MPRCSSGGMQCKFPSVPYELHALTWGTQPSLWLGAWLAGLPRVNSMLFSLFAAHLGLLLAMPYMLLCTTGAELSHPFADTPPGS